MDPVIGGALISAGSNLLGSLFGSKPDVQDPHEQFRKVFHEKMNLGKQYGISKLVMAGVPANYAPYAEAGSNLGETLGQMGQDIGRAVATQKTGPERMATRLQLEGAALNNELLQAQIRSLNTRTLREAGPPAPVSAGPGAWPMKQEPPQRTTHIPAGGFDIHTNPNVADANTFTNRYGESEILEMLTALAIGGADVNQTLSDAGYGGAWGPAAAGQRIRQLILGR